MENDIELVTNSVSSPNSVVILQNACKNYGSKKNFVCVLKNLNMTVPKGVIYGLLGSSGCGKTTLLNCMLGQKELDDGKVWILGGSPNSKNSKVPGPSIGYMPQSVGVQPEFTTRETMQYIGEIVGMSKNKIAERIKFLQQLLMLPNLDLTIGNLSGGEKRRVSFAVALIHEPELLVLDEPTVGLDPLLRDSIWSYLHELTTKHQVTVILTTHYIDETRNANIISMLRGGAVLAEESPNRLLARLGVYTLEEAYFTLSTRQSTNDNNLQSISNAEIVNRNFEIESSNTMQNSTKRRQVNNLKPLLQKNYKWLIKNPMLLVFSMVIPAFQIFIFNISIGHDPINLNLAVVNEETTIRNCSPATCDSIQLSCNFLQYLERSKLNLIYYENEDSAIKSVQYGKSYASIYLRFNYSAALKERVKFKIYEDWDLLYSNIDVYRDVSNYNIGIYLKGKLLQSFDSFVHDYLKSCNSKKRISIPIKFNEPVYGKKMPDFTEFALPALILSSVCFFSAWSTASVLLTEFTNGVTERLLVLGVNPLYLLLAHAITEFLIMVTHIITVLISLFLILKFPLEGSLLIMALIILVEGFCGMCFGFALSSICTSDDIAVYVILGSFFPAGVLSGIVWPLEGMPKLMREIGFLLPFTEPSEAMRSVMQRGWGITYYPIYTSFAIVIAWTVIFLSITVFSIKYKKK